KGTIEHALRFTLSKTRRAYVPPASHWASDDADESLPPMGVRVRLKADYDISLLARGAGDPAGAQDLWDDPRRQRQRQLHQRQARPALGPRHAQRDPRGEDQGSRRRRNDRARG